MSRVRHAVEYGAYLAFYGLVRALPHRAARPLGSLLGEVAYRFDRRHRRVARNNVAAVFPELDESARESLVHSCHRHFGGAICDRLSMTRFTAEQICRRLTLNGWDHLLQAESHGRGVLLLTAHLGSWEIMADPFAIFHGPCHLIYRPMDNPHLDRQMRCLRERFGNVGVARRGAARRAMRALRNGERVCFLADQRVHPHEGIELPFLGRPAMTSTLPARLALRFGAPAIPIFCYPEKNAGYRLEVRPAIWPEEAGDHAVAALTRRYVAATETEIRDHPDMWMWTHDRWRQRQRPGTTPRAER